MSLKRPRIHLSGISNIENKSNQDTLKIISNFNNIINKEKNEEEEEDDFLEDQEAKYKAPKPKSPNLYNISIQESKEQTGDSLMYANTHKIINEIKLKKMENENEKKIKKINTLLDVFNNSQQIDNNNKKIDLKKHFNTEKNEIIKKYENDEERIQQLRNIIKNRLSTHTDVKNIFMSWQKNYLKNQELSVYDLHKKINELNIPISYNETIGLINFSNKRNTNSLNFDEFKNLFFNDSGKSKKLKNISIIIPNNIDIKKIEYDNKKEKEDMNKIFINQKVLKNDNFITLEKILQVKHSLFLKSMNEINNKENNKNGYCDFLTFKKALDTLKIPEKYKNISISKGIFNEFKIPGKDLMNYNDFIDKCKNMKHPNNFFEFKNNYLNLISKKLNDNEKQRKKYKDILLEEDLRKKEYARNLSSSRTMGQIINDNLDNNKNQNKIDYINQSQNSPSNDYKYKIQIKNDHYNNRNKNNNLNFCTISYDNRDFSHYQPSLNFINLIHKDGRKYLDRYNEGIKEFSPKESFNSNERLMSAKIKEEKNLGIYNQQHKKNILSYDIDSPENNEKMLRNGFSNNEKIDNYKSFEKNNSNKFEIKKRWDDIIDFQQKVTDVKESLGQIKRTKNLFEYENRILERNKLQ